MIKLAALLPTTYKAFSNILISRLILYVNVTAGGLQCGFQSNISTTDHIICIRQILGQYISYLCISRRPMTRSGEKFCTIFSLNVVHL